ncbi:agmatine deiminase family protein [Helicobacter felis]|uniref:agmatine deiminase family protein n=1 Tax=Helicobacter felis TaxID=214 RepID=UPI000CF0545C|nr:agmatine deiminase family protein [Helicobacter felis]
MARFKAEWEEQSAILMAFPHASSDWGAYLSEAQECFLNIINTLAGYQRVLVCVHTSDSAGIDRLSRLSNVEVVLLDTNDTWARDFGPLCVETAGVHFYLSFVFNAWGNKYQSKLDNAISMKLAQKGFLRHPLRFVDVVLEGGSLECDGAGTLLANRYSLLNSNRNPDPEKSIARIKQELSLSRILWIDTPPLAGDDTDGHIDTLVRFLDLETIAYVSCNDPTDPQYQPLKAMEQTLQSFRTLENKRYKLIPLPLPSPKYYQDQRLPATYANFLFANSGGQRVLFVPTYNDPLDAHILKTLEKHTQIEVVGVDCSFLIREHGSLHCATMQLY